MFHFKKLFFVLFLLALSTACETGTYVEDVAQEISTEVANYDVETAVSIGITVGIFSISVDHEGTIEVAVVAATPAIPTPLGAFTMFVEGSAAFPEKKTLTITTGQQTWVYDLNDTPFRVELHSIDATITGDGNGNILVEVKDDRVQSNKEPQFRSVPIEQLASTGKNIAVAEFIIGQSANGHTISGTRIGEGSRAIVLVGGFHAGFAPGTVELAEDLIDYFQAHGNEVPANISLYIIPMANPDSAGQGVESKEGRLNGNGVDINRNWGCNWTANAQWRDVPINAGSGPFSEPETQAFKDFFLTLRPHAVIFWEARGNLVIPGVCNGSSLSDSQNLASAYGSRSGYEYGFITGYAVTGDVADWLNQEGTPAIAVLLSNYTGTDWSRNLAGVQDVIQTVAIEIGD